MDELIETPEVIDPEETGLTVTHVAATILVVAVGGYVWKKASGWFGNRGNDETVEPLETVELV
jgi:hypothetical protein